MDRPGEDCDPLKDVFTGLPNRKGLQLHLAEEYGRAKMLRLPISLLAIDLDRFAEVNARHFIPGGDKILADFARLVSSSTRPGDVAARDGGDQFSLILLDTDSDGACREAERFRLMVGRNAFEVREGRVELTASFGFATATFTESEPWELFVRARNGVHRAKDLGRNRVEVG